MALFKLPLEQRADCPSLDCISGLIHNGQLDGLRVGSGSSGRASQILPLVLGQAIYLAFISYTHSFGKDYPYAMVDGRVSQRTTCTSDPSTLWVLGSNLGLSALAVSALACQALSQIFHLSFRLFPS